MKRYLYTFEQWRLNVLVSAWHQTTHEAEDIEYGGKTYVRTNIAHGGFQLNAEKSAGTLELKVLRDHPVAQRFLSGYPSGTFRVAILELDDDDSERLIYAGKVRAVEFEELQATMTCTDALDQMQRPGLRFRYAPPCGWALYGPDCGVDRAAHARTGTITSVSDDGLTLGTTLNEATDFFAAGLLEADGQSRLLTASTGGTLTLFAPIDGLQPGDSITAYRGCNRSVSDCKTKFGNVANYGGFHFQTTKNIFYTGLK